MKRPVLIIVMAGLLAGAAVLAQESGGIDPEALIERILSVERAQRAEVHDVTFDVEYVEREDKGDEGYKEKIRIVKKAYLKYVDDTCLYAEKYLELYKDGELKSEKDLRNEEKDRKEKKAKRNGRDISFPMLQPFHEPWRSLYDIEYLGVAPERIEGRVCHHFKAKALEESDSLMNADYFFEAETFHLVQIDFQPAKLVKKTMFKLKEFNASLVYGVTPEGYWLPRQFDIQGKGKAAFFFGVSFAGTTYFRHPQVNTGLDDSLFEVTDDN